MSGQAASVPVHPGMRHFRCNNCWEKFFDQDGEPGFSVYKIRRCNHLVCEKCVEDFQAEQNRVENTTTPGSPQTSSSAGQRGAVAAEFSNDFDYCPVCRRRVAFRTDVVEITRRDLFTSANPNAELLKEICLNPHSASSLLIKVSYVNTMLFLTMVLSSPCY